MFTSQTVYFTCKETKFTLCGALVCLSCQSKIFYAFCVCFFYLFYVMVGDTEAFVEMS